MKKKAKTIDMTNGPIFGPLVLFILPLIGGSIFQQLYNTVDFIFVGNFLDKTAAAAVGASATLINCTIGLFTGIAVGTTVVAARAIGGGDLKRAEKTIHTSVTLGIIGGIVLMAVGILFSPGILRLLNTPESVMPQAILYIRIYLISLPMLFFYNIVSGGLRAEGDSSTPFKVLVICGLLNVVFDAFFIVVVKMGVAGVAVATTLTQSLSALMIGIFASRKGRTIRFSFRKLRIDGALLKGVLRIGLPAGIQTIIITISNVFVQYFINDFGETAVAAFATYYKVENLIFLSILAVGQASTTFAGQNMGAGNYRRIRKGSIIMLCLGAGITIVVAGLILLFPNVVFRWFMKDPDVIANAISLAMVSFPFYWIYPAIEVFGGAIRSLGYSITSMVVIIINLCVVRIGLLSFFSKTIHTMQSLAAVYPITWATAAISFTVIFFIVIRKFIKKNESNDLPKDIA